MGALEDLVERRIRRAIAEGDFEDLPGRGRPLALDDDALVPEELRLAYRVLKNAGYLPEELELRREIAGIHASLEALLDSNERRHAAKRLALLRTRLAACGGERPLSLDGEYGERIARRLGGGRD